MAGKTIGAGLGQKAKNLFIILIGAGVALAILRAFNYDPFGVVEWVWSWIAKVVTSISDWLFHNNTFKEVTSKPKS